jgi:hypothetical protein
VFASVGTFFLPHQDDPQRGRESGQCLEKIDVAFERSPVGDHEDVDLPSVPGFGLEAIGVKPVSGGEQLRAADAGVKSVEFGALLKGTGKDGNGTGDTLEEGGQEAIISGGPAGAPENLILLGESVPVADLGKQSKPVVFELDKKNATLAAGTGGLEKKTAGERRVGGDLFGIMGPFVIDPSGTSGIFARLSPGLPFPPESRRFGDLKSREATLPGL